MPVFPFRTRLTNCVIALVTLSALSLRAEIIVSNFNESPTDFLEFNTVSVDVWPGQQFTTPDVPLRFDGASIRIGSSDLNVPSGDFQLSLLTDNLDTPGIPVLVLQGASNPDQNSDYYYSAGSDFTLLPDTKYWLVAKVTSGDGYYGWTANDNLKSDVGIIGRQAFAYSGSWQDFSDDGPQYFQIAASPVPEPSETSLFVVLGIGIVITRRAINRQQQGRRFKFPRCGFRMGICRQQKYG